MEIFGAVVARLIWLTAAWVAMIVVVAKVSSGANPRFRVLLIAITVASLPSYVFFLQPWYLKHKIVKDNSERLQRDVATTEKFSEICSKPSTTHVYRATEYREPVHLLVTTLYGQDFEDEGALRIPKKFFAERSSLDFNVSEGCWVKRKFDEKCLPSNLGEIDQEIVSQSCFYVNKNFADHCQRSIFRISQDGSRLKIEKSEANYLLVVRDYELVYSKTNTEFEPDIVRFKLDVFDRATHEPIAETYIYKRRWLSNDTSRRGALYCGDIDAQVAEFLNKVFPFKWPS